MVYPYWYWFWSWVLTLRGSKKYCFGFGGTCCFHIQGRNTGPRVLHFMQLLLLRPAPRGMLKARLVRIQSIDEHPHSTSITSTLKMDAECVSETLVTLPTSTQCNDTKAETTLSKRMFLNKGGITCAHLYWLQIPSHWLYLSLFLPPPPAVV
jgi:hypothetical protein